MTQLWSFLFANSRMLNSKFTSVLYVTLLPLVSIHCRDKSLHCLHIFVIFPLLFVALTAVMPFPCQIQKFHKIKSRSYNKYSHSINKQIAKHTQSSHIHIIKIKNLAFIFSVGLISITRHCNTFHKIRHRIPIQNVEHSTSFSKPCLYFILYD